MRRRAKCGISCPKIHGGGSLGRLEVRGVRSGGEGARGRGPFIFGVILSPVFSIGFFSSIPEEKPRARKGRPGDEGKIIDVG